MLHRRCSTRTIRPRHRGELLSRRAAQSLDGAPTSPGRTARRSAVRWSGVAAGCRRLSRVSSTSRRRRGDLRSVYRAYQPRRRGRGQARPVAPPTKLSPSYLAIGSSGSSTPRSEQRSGLLRSGQPGVPDSGLGCCLQLRRRGRGRHRNHLPGTFEEADRRHCEVTHYGKDMLACANAEVDAPTAAVLGAVMPATACWRMAWAYGGAPFLIVAQVQPTAHARLIDRVRVDLHDSASAFVVGYPAKLPTPSTIARGEFMRCCRCPRPEDTIHPVYHFIGERLPAKCRLPEREAAAGEFADSAPSPRMPSPIAIPDMPAPAAQREIERQRSSPAPTHQ